MCWFRRGMGCESVESLGVDHTAGANALHSDHAAIGYRNWQSYEIEKNYEKETAS